MLGSGGPQPQLPTLHPQHVSCSPHFQPGSAYRVPLLQLPGGPTGGQQAAPGSLYPPSAHTQTLPGSPCCHHCLGAGQPLCRTVADAPAGPCILRGRGSQDRATAIALPSVPVLKFLPRRMVGPPCSSCALCHWLRCTMSWYCWATSWGTGRRACLRATI